MPSGDESRNTPFPDFLAELLLEPCEDETRDALVFVFVFVFGDGTTDLLTSTHGHDWFEYARNRALFADPSFPLSLTLHGLRHTAASLAGANNKAVRRVLGHETAAMTLDTYADLFYDDLDAVAIALNDARRASSAFVREVPYLRAASPSHQMGITK